MIIIKNQAEILRMKDACKISALALKKASLLCQEGITTKEIDREIEKLIRGYGATPSFLGYHGYPASTCISINDVVIHGIPSNRKLKNGDIVSVDVGAYYGGYHGDNAATFPVGNISTASQTLIDVTKKSLMLAIEKAVSGNRLGDIGYAVESYVNKFGFYPVREFVGHGIGKNMHEKPDVPNYGKAHTGVRLSSGMVLAIEPMICEVSPDVYIEDDDWTVVTSKGGNSAHFEHTVAITDDGPVILTLCED